MGKIGHYKPANTQIVHATIRERLSRQLNKVVLKVESLHMIRNMAEKVPSFQSGGALWFTDLTTPHNLLILPVLTSLTFLITVEALFCYWLTSNLLSLTYGLGTVLFLSSAIEQDTTVESGPSLPTIPSKVADRRISRTSILKQRLKSLENQIKERNKQKKM
ncbi:inner membrane protein OXA1-like protein [Prunus dulcis]|uniref:Inner membrane protein OXA1-like protein n=1 Tax=Prunus dulcis TaxID=3755 RepID=A0A4Y1R0M5_PRUDU|nr:inner membrane protein OXA1-like protein [Prunus dulcis]